jgi:hypothetical protein
MASLCQRMIEDMRVRNLTPPLTQKTCADRVAQFARLFGKSPESLGPEEILTYQAYMINNKNASWSVLDQSVFVLHFHGPNDAFNLEEKWKILSEVIGRCLEAVSLQIEPSAIRKCALDSN